MRENRGQNEKIKIDINFNCLRRNKFDVRLRLRKSIFLMKEATSGIDKIMSKLRNGAF